MNNLSEIFATVIVQSQEIKHSNALEGDTFILPDLFSNEDLLCPDKLIKYCNIIHIPIVKIEKYCSEDGLLHMLCEVKIIPDDKEVYIKEENVQAPRNDAFQNSSYALKFNELYEDSCEVDFQIVCKEETFNVYKVVLIAHGSVFRTMLVYHKETKEYKVVQRSRARRGE
uniref:BTB domain-containing protein n=1 Tax=Strongyloides papillosus TaxID=174720 RepID=A0A0N5BBJ4_STREA